MWTRHRDSQAIEGSVSDGDGGYIASASDLMIGLLFVFIILVVVLALEQRRQQQEIENERAGLLGAGDPRGAVTTAVGDGIKAALPGVRVDRESGVISLPEDVLFDLGSADLSNRGRDALMGAVGRLSEVLPCFVSSQRAGLACPINRYGHEIETIFIEGHTDNRPILRTGYDNTKLSLDRARAVEQALVQGTPLQGYRNKSGQPLFSFSAYGESRPLKGMDPSDARNRRVDLRIVLTYRPIGELIPGLVPKQVGGKQ
jgi:chemotaxis protein MotB